MEIKCRLCNGSISKVFQQKVLHLYPVDYFCCHECGFLQTEKPYWLEEAYSSAICSSDTGLVARNIALSRKISFLLASMFPSEARFVDYAGGTGLFVRLMRDLGFDFQWFDPYCVNVHARGFEYTGDCKKITALTAFEVFEHLESPLFSLREILETTGADTIVFTTLLYGDFIPPSNWWYYGFDTGQHIGFYQKRTLQYLARSLKMNFYSFSGIHMFTKCKNSPLLYALKVSSLGKILFQLYKITMKSLTQQDSLDRLKDCEASCRNDVRKTR